MYSVMLFLHSWVRWVLLVFMGVVLIRSLLGWLKQKKYDQTDTRLRIWTVSLFDLQVLIGVYMYTFLSPTVHAAFDSGMEFMKDNQVRFFVVEHLTGMLAALFVLHAGSVFCKKADTPVKQHKRMAITLILTLLVVLASIPWPGLPYGRVLFRGF